MEETYAQFKYAYIIPSYNVFPVLTFDVISTNLFGGLAVARAFLPYMRPRKTGTIAWIGSVCGWIPSLLLVFMLAPSML